MAKRNILILTGAGFGKFGKDAGLPLEEEIMPFGVKVCEKKKPGLLEGLTKQWQKIDKSKSFKEYSFEEALTKVILEEQLSFRTEEERLELLDIKLGILEILVQSLKKPLMSESEIPRHYFDFIYRYKDYAHFATLNYDYLIEEILIQEKIPWNYGINVDENDLSLRHSYLKGEEGDFPDVFRYYKLHGSFNWHFCWRCQNIRISDLRYFGISGENFSETDRFTQSCDRCARPSGQAVLQPLVIPPSAIKYYNIPIFLELWFIFTRIIQQVEKIILIGCSVRDDDTMLIQALYNLSQRNPNLRKIVVINPDKKIENKVRSYTNFNNIKSYNSLEDFLRTH